MYFRDSSSSNVYSQIVIAVKCVMFEISLYVERMLLYVGLQDYSERENIIYWVITIIVCRDGSMNYFLNHQIKECLLSS